MKPPQPSRAARRRLILATLAVLFFALLCLLAELCARLLLPYRNPLRLFVKPVVLEDMQRSMAPVVEFDVALSYRLRPGIRDGFLAATHFSTNAAGLRSTREVGAKPRGGIRILCLGDSCTFGFGVPGVDVNEKRRPYAERAEELLRASFPGSSIEVLNLGVPGYSSGHGVVVLERALAEFGADFVTAMFLNNDIVDPGSSARASTPRGSARALRHLAAHSQLAVHLIGSSQRLYGKHKLQGFGTAYTGLEDYVANFDHMRRLCVEKGAGFVPINPFSQRNPEDDPWLPGHRVPQYRAALLAYAAAAQLPVLDVPELTEAGFPANEPLFIERVHPNADGHELAAQRLHDFLRPLVAERLARGK